MREITVSRGEANRRLDKYLMKYMNMAPPNFIYKMLRKKRIKLNGARAGGNETLCEGDIITFYLSDDTICSFSALRTIPEYTGKLDILYEDKDILLVNKPAGMLVHSDTPYGADDLASRLVYYLSQKGLLSGTFTPAPGNRLDRNTSGIVICGKHPAAVRALNEAQAEKYYIAVVSGVIGKPSELKGFIDKDPRKNESTVSDKPYAKAGRIITEYTPIGRGENLTLLRVKLVTGKSHQIRAHLKAAGHPILGDPKYGDPQINNQMRLKRQLLHAVQFTLLNNSDILEKYNYKTFWAPIPDYLRIFIEKEIEVFPDESHYFSCGLRNKIISPDAH